MYDLAYSSKNYLALKVLFEKEMASKEKNALKRIIKYDLIDISIKSKDISFIKKVFSYKKFNFEYLKYEEILSTAFRNYKSINSTPNDNEITIFLIKSILSPPYSTSTYKNVILNIAIMENNLALVQFLIESKDFKYTSKDINSKGLKGEYPIIKAMSNKNTEIFDYLLEKGADYNTKNGKGEPLLLLAIYKNDINTVVSLINDNTRDKINVNILNKNGYTPLKICYDSNYMEIFNYLIYYSNLNKIDSYGHTILYYVKKYEKRNNLAKKLMNIGAKESIIISWGIEKYNSLCTIIDFILENIGELIRELIKNYGPLLLLLLLLFIFTCFIGKLSFRITEDISNIYRKNRNKYNEYY